MKHRHRTHRTAPNNLNTTEQQLSEGERYINTPRPPGDMSEINVRDTGKCDHTDYHPANTAGKRKQTHLSLGDVRSCLVDFLRHVNAEWVYPGGYGVSMGFYIWEQNFLLDC